MHKVIIGKKRLKRLVSLPTTGTRKWRSKDSREGAGSVSFSEKICCRDISIINTPCFTNTMPHPLCKQADNLPLHQGFSWISLRVKKNLTQRF